MATLAEAIRSTAVEDLPVGSIGTAIPFQRGPLNLQLNVRVVGEDEEGNRTFLPYAPYSLQILSLCCASVYQANLGDQVICRKCETVVDYISEGEVGPQSLLSTHRRGGTIDLLARLHAERTTGDTYDSYLYGLAVEREIKAAHSELITEDWALRLYEKINGKQHERREKLAKLKAV